MKLDSSSNQQQHQQQYQAASSNVMLQPQPALINTNDRQHQTNQTNNIQFYNQPYSLISIEQLKQQQQDQKTLKPSNVDSTALASSSDTDDSDNENDIKSNHVYLSFDVSSQAASLLKKLALENDENLRDIGILSVQLQNEPNDIKLSKKPKKEDTIAVEQNKPLTSTTCFQTQEPQQAERPAVPNNQTQQQQPTQSKKRNRKTINELTSSNYLLNETNQNQFFQSQPPPAPQQQQFGRNLQLEISLSNLNDTKSNQHNQMLDLNNRTKPNENDQKPQLQQVKQFYQIDMNGNIQQTVPANPQYKPNLQQQPQNFQNNLNSSNKGNFHYQLTSQQQQQQYQMPSPMLANLLAEQQSPKVKNPDLYSNSSPVLIRQLPNGNYDQPMGTPNFQQPDSYHQPTQPDFNLMKSEDYKLIYQMRQLLASQADPGVHHQPTEVLQVNNHVNNSITSTNKSHVQHGSRPTATESPKPAPKRKRAPADPTKSRAKKSKAAANSKVESPSQTNIAYPNNNNMSPVNQHQQQQHLQQQLQQFANPPESKLKTVNNLINELRMDMSQQQAQLPPQIQPPQENNPNPSLSGDNAINYINYLNSSQTPTEPTNNSLNLVDKILNENLKKFNNNDQRGEFKFDHNVQSMDSFVNFPQKNLNYVSLKLDNNPMTSSVSSSSSSNSTDTNQTNQFHIGQIPKAIQRHNSNSNGQGASSTCIPSSSGTGVNNDSSNLAESPLKSDMQLQQHTHS